jgi:hypothetical protein
MLNGRIDNMRSSRDNVVLLFYKDFERDSFFPNDRYMKRLARPVYHLFSKGPKVSGFYVWYQLLIKALRQQGYDVRLNDYAFARKYPDHPVGLVGYPHLLDNWNLPNPAILGPSLFDHPKNAPDLLNDPRYKFYLVTCEWMYNMFRPYYGDQCVQWYAGMDIKDWSDTRTYPKSTDVLIYDKIRWNRDIYEPALLTPIIRYLQERGHTYQIVRYRQYDHATYKELLKQSRCMIFLCEHETQGMAYQEALASNVPIIAWDNGFWLDPQRERFDPNPVPASSVPYFSAQCGERFTEINSFLAVFDKFWANLENYRPRDYVQRELSFEGSASIYMKYYDAIRGVSGAVQENKPVQKVVY